MTDAAQTALPLLEPGQVWRSAEGHSLLITDSWDGLAGVELFRPTPPHLLLARGHGLKRYLIDAGFLLTDAVLALTIPGDE